MNLVTQEEAAKILRRSVVTIYRWRRIGLLPAIQGRPVMIDMQDIEKLKQIKIWPDQKQDRDSKLTISDIMKSVGMTTAGVTAFQRGQRKFLKRRRS